jgi:cytochrome c oxidase cbb3-type subunit 3
MSSRFRTADRLAAGCLIAALLLLATSVARGDDPTFRTAEPGPLATPTTTLFPGGGSMPPLDPRAKAYEGNSQAIAEGARLFDWYNCSGCHFHGAGGMGPSLMDKLWIYGGRIDQIRATIVQGRPNGMPSWEGKIPDEQIWQIAAYVRSLSASNTANGPGQAMPTPPPPPFMPQPAQNTQP